MIFKVPVGFGVSLRILNLEKVGATASQPQLLLEYAPLWPLELQD